MRKALLFGVLIIVVAFVSRFIIFPTPTKNSTQSHNSSEIVLDVPLPSARDIVSLFVTLIDEGRIEEAIAMMNPNLIGDDTMKQAWGVQMNAITEMIAKRIDPYEELSWTNMQERYQVLLEVQLRPEAAYTPIPNYGWEPGENNVRWITMEKNEQNHWMISSIATSP